MIGGSATAVGVSLAVQQPSSISTGAPPEVASRAPCPGPSAPHLLGFHRAWTRIPVSDRLRSPAYQQSTRRREQRKPRSSPDCGRPATTRNRARRQRRRRRLRSPVSTAAPEGVPDGPPEGVPDGPPAGVPAGPPDSVPAGPPDSVPDGPPEGVPAGSDSVPAGPPGDLPSDGAGGGRGGG
jgi:hypothetical protein